MTSTLREACGLKADPLDHRFEVDLQALTKGDKYPQIYFSDLVTAQEEVHSQDLEKKTVGLKITAVNGVIYNNQEKKFRT